MTTLTIHFDDDRIEPIVVHNCEKSEGSDDEYALPSGSDNHVDEIVAAMRTRSRRELYTEWFDNLDS
jgi:hypothetical protein